MNPQIFRSSNKRRTGRDSEIHLFFLRYFLQAMLSYFFFFFTFSIYVSETDAKYTLVDSCRAVCHSGQPSNHFYPADFPNRNGHV